MISGHKLLTIAATASNGPITATAPFDISEAPSNTTTHFELENGSGHLILEDATEQAPATTRPRERLVTRIKG